MAYQVTGTESYSFENVSFTPAYTEKEAWDNAIDAWKGVPTRNRPKFRARALEAMQRNGYKCEIVR